MTVAVPWPLKSILDNVVGNHPVPLWISWLLPVLGGNTKVHIAEAAALLTVVIAAVTGAAMYLASTLTERLGQSIEKICGSGSITTCRSFRWPITTPTGWAPS